jgi:hypothetical protein
MPYYMPKEQI